MVGRSFDCSQTRCDRASLDDHDRRSPPRQRPGRGKDFYRRARIELHGRAAALRPPARLSRHGRRRADSLSLLLHALHLRPATGTAGKRSFGLPRLARRGAQLSCGPAPPTAPMTAQRSLATANGTAEAALARSRKSSVEPVLIAGAGIGGLAAAIALARRGIASHVLERRPAFQEEGAGIQIGPN